VVAGATNGLSSTLVNNALAVVRDATDIWGRYFNFAPGAVIDIQVDFSDLPDMTLAQAGPTFFFDRSVNGVDIFQAGTLIELSTGVDRNGSTRDIRITIDSVDIQDGSFFLGGVMTGGPSRGQIDLLTVVLHEIGHGLGFLSFDFEDLTEQSTLDTFIAGPASNRVFTGPNAVAAFGGAVPLASEPSHLRASGQLLSAAISQGTRLNISAVEVAILQDIGAPVRVATSGADTIYGFEATDIYSLLGGNDIYFALGGNDVVHGDDGNDTLHGDGGADTLFGDNGDDTLFGGAGADTLNGGAGSDLVDYSSLSGAIVLTAASVTSGPAEAAGDQFISIERFTLTGFNDSFAGGTASDTVRLGAGADFADGRDGSDTIFGEAGNDTILGGAGGDSLDGGDGDDLLDGGAGPDAIAGGSGVDIATYRNAAARVTFVAGNPAAGTGDAQGDAISADVESIEGSLFNDLFTGDAGNNEFNGLLGGDVLAGLSGSDVLNGGDGYTVSANGAAVFRMYQATLDRAPDPGGFAAWQAELNAGRSVVSIASGFVGSAEFQSVYGALDNTAFVTLLYANALGRAPDPGGLNGWVGLLNGGASRESVVVGFSDSPEFQRLTSQGVNAFATFTLNGDETGQTFRLYQVALGRLPDEGGFLNWSTALVGGLSLETTAASFVASPEFQAVYGPLDNTAFVTLLYNNALGRAPDPAGLDGWVGLLTGGASRAFVVTGFSESAEFIALSAPDLVGFARTGLPTLADTIDGGAGDDFLFGGRGADVFDFRAIEAGVDQVFGFEDFDQIRLAGFGYASAAEALSFFTQTPDGALFSDQGQQILFHDAAIAQIASAGFIFA
ncbi:MAG: DUF4214 domain-containing protein, partial [Parvularculaceae bacterium]